MVEANLEVLREILITLKRYGFELNMKKCQFLKRQIEYLGYILSHNKIEISSRHTETISNFHSHITLRKSSDS